MSQASSETALRYITMLRFIPKYPAKRTVKEIEYHLDNRDFFVSSRTIERDLIKLSNHFGLTCDDRSKPHGWSFLEGSRGIELAYMDRVEALSLQMAEKYLKDLLPHNNYERINNLFKQANSVLKDAPDSNLINWGNKVRISHNAQRLIAPEIDQTIQDIVYKSILNEKKLKIDYRKTNAKKSESRIINPLGLVLQGVVHRVICTMSPDFEITRHLPLHRFKGAEELDEYIEMPLGFDIDHFINEEGGLGFPRSNKKQKIKLLFKEWSGYHLTETPLSENQIIKKVDGKLLLEASVRLTDQLRWWILGFGEDVEVLEPDSLRKEIVRNIENMSELYS